uniref:Uncharacterized protein n=1 Tax=Knipowitschia caucasica TaxID=637954 RepID=A0AAV2JS97_KNICA
MATLDNSNILPHYADTRGDSGRDQSFQQPLKCPARSAAELRCRENPLIAHSIENQARPLRTSPTEKPPHLQSFLDAHSVRGVSQATPPAVPGHAPCGARPRPPRFPDTHS